jgi:hypothetical protein
MTSAGITSGLDAVLHFIARRNGDAVARAVSSKLHYPSYAYVDSPRVEQYAAGADLIGAAAINILFHPDQTRAGVLLYDGVGELELASTFDTYVASYTTNLLSVADTRRPITTQHGLQVVPRWDFSDLPAMEQLIVPGAGARQLADASRWPARVLYIHADQPDQFAFDAPLRDLARQQSSPSAVLAAMRLEYRPGAIQTDGAAWPVWLTVRPLLLGLAGLAVAVLVKTRWQRRGLIGPDRRQPAPSSSALAAVGCGRSQ